MERSTLLCGDQCRYLKSPELGALFTWQHARRSERLRNFYPGQLEPEELQVKLLVAWDPHKCCALVHANSIMIA